MRFLCTELWRHLAITLHLILNVGMAPTAKSNTHPPMYLGLWASCVTGNAVLRIQHPEVLTMTVNDKRPVWWGKGLQFIQACA